MKKGLVFISIISLIFTSLPFQVFAQEDITSIPSATPALSENSTPSAPQTPDNSNLAPPIEYNVFDNVNPQTPGINPTVDNQNSQTSASFGLPVRVHQLSKKNFKGDEKITIVVENTKVTDLKVSLYDVDGNNVGVRYEEVSGENPAVIRLIPPAQFKAGRYRLVITDPTGSTTTQDFTWGVLAINPNKSVYFPNETANIAMAVLDETGEMVCDAQVTLRIQNQTLGIDDTLSTQNGKIKVNRECSSKDFTLTPDYQSIYQVGGVGVYNLTLTAVTKNGTYSEDDSFQVSSTQAFDVERVNATRLYPPLTYPSVFNITANQDFVGTITEKVPESFAISQLGQGTDPFDVASVSADFSGITSDSSSSAIPNLSLPFDGNYPIDLKFGEQLYDPNEKSIYAQFGLLGHDGVDFGLPSGTPVLAADTGVVIMADENGPYGTTIVLQHPWGRSYYGHLSFMTAQVGQTILKGHPMGMSGNTGLSTGPHLHFGIKPNNNDINSGYYGKIDPLPYLGLQGFDGTSSKVFFSTAASYNYGEKLLSWDVNLKKGDKIKLGYNYKVPNVSPQFYLLGPLEFIASDSSSVVFQESRQWQLAVDADGSGTNTVSPTTGQVNATGQLYTFTYTTGESVATGSGAFTIQEPSSNDWTMPQTSDPGALGYTTVDSSSTAVVGDILDNGDSNTSWVNVGANACGGAAPTVTAASHPEGTGALNCVNGNVGSGNGLGKNISSSNWTNYTTVGAWIKTSSAISTTTNYRFSYDDTASLASPIANIALSSTTVANQWTWETFTLTGTRNAIVSFGFTSGSSTALDSVTQTIDYILIGPGKPVITGNNPWTITSNIVTIPASTGKVVLKYGAGVEGVTNSSSATTHTFTTQSKIATNPRNTLTNIGASPTVTLSSGPTLSQLMRHGKWFSNSGNFVEQPFTF